jgi:DNA-binding MarR family transcriptional regulator
VEQNVNAAFLLTQLGTHAANRFAERVAALGVSPPQVGLLRWIAQSPGNSQQAMAKHFDTQPSRVVTFVDELEELGLAQRRPDPQDRRVRIVELTDRGREVMRGMRKVMEEHEEEILAPFSAEERARLHDLLRRMAEQAGLTPGVHPGYRSLPPRTAKAR